MVIDNSAYRPMAWVSPPTTPQNYTFTPTFQPSFQSSLAPQQLQFNPGFSGMSSWGNGMQQPVPVQQQPAVPALQVPTTQAQAPVISGGAFQGAAAGAALPNGAIAPQASYLNTPQSQWTGEMMENFLKKNQPSQVGNYANMALQGVGMAANIGMGIASLVQSQDAFNKQMGMANKNYAAQIKAYNNSLEDKIRGRYSAGTNHEAEIQAELERKKQKE